jgi:hypothetical protein
MGLLFNLLRAVASASRQVAAERGMSLSWLGGRKSLGRVASACRQPPRARLSIEPLEERQVLGSVVFRPPAPVWGSEQGKQILVRRGVFHPPAGLPHPGRGVMASQERFRVAYYNDIDQKWGWWRPERWPTMQKAEADAQDVCAAGFPKGKIFIYDYVTGKYSRYLCKDSMQGPTSTPMPAPQPTPTPTPRLSGFVEFFYRQGSVWVPYRGQIANLPYPRVGACSLAAGRQWLNEVRWVAAHFNGIPVGSPLVDSLIDLRWRTNFPPNFFCGPDGFVYAGPP